MNPRRRRHNRIRRKQRTRRHVDWSSITVTIADVVMHGSDAFTWPFEFKRSIG